jgi:membrane-associated protease RseP (regulator of RpoE activity)
MLELVGIVAFVLLVGISIGLHELGHMLPAKRFGIKVIDYSIGMGPTVFRRTRGETTYNIRLLPIGGFIRMIGMYPPAHPSNKPVRGRWAEEIEQARAATLEDVTPDEEHRTFYRASVPKRLVIMMAGPAMNLFLAAILFAIILVGLGIPQPSGNVGTVIPCVPTLSDPAGKGTIVGCELATPAARAGITPGDRIVSVDGKPTSDWIELIDTLAAVPAGQTIDVVIENQLERQRTVTLALAEIEYETFDDSGKPTGTRTRPFLGIGPEYVWVTQGWSSVPTAMWDLTSRSAAALAAFPQKIYELALNLVSNEERDPTGPVSVVGVGRISAEIAASDMAFRAKVVETLSLVAGLNLFLFLFNLLPILPLDGGHVAAALYEGARRRWSALRGKPDPGPVDVARLLPVTYIASAIILTAGVLVIFADIIKPISLPY